MGELRREEEDSRERQDFKWEEGGASRGEDDVLRLGSIYQYEQAEQEMNRDLSSRRFVFERYITPAIESAHDASLHEIWDENQLSGLSMPEYLDRVKQYGSGHFVTHITKPEHLGKVLSRGYLLPTRLETEGHEKTKNPLVSSRAIHFSLDELYRKDAKSPFLFFPIEFVMENKSFSGIPLEYAGATDRVKNDMAVRGSSSDPEDSSNRLLMNAGIIFIPSGSRVFKETGEFTVGNWNEADTPTISAEEYLASLPVKYKAVFYEGSAGKALQDFLESNGIPVPDKNKKIKTSGDVKFKYKLGESGGGHYHPEGEGSYFGI